LEDLKADTATFQRYARDNEIRAAITDSLMYLLKSPERKTETTRIYYLARILTMRSDYLLPNERTYEQMKFSGQLRLIKNQQVSDGISNYYNSLKKIVGQNERISERSSHYFLSVDKLFDAQVFLKIAKELKEPENKSIQLLSEDPKVINELLTRVQYFFVTCLFAANYGLESCKEAERLIELIKKEYHLK
jgi:preprotein translocase subunit Sec63